MVRRALVALARPRAATRRATLTGLISFDMRAWPLAAVFHHMIPCIPLWPRSASFVGRRQDRNNGLGTNDPVFLAQMSTILIIHKAAACTNVVGLLISGSRKGMACLHGSEKHGTLSEQASFAPRLWHQGSRPWK